MKKAFKKNLGYNIFFLSCLLILAFVVVSFSKELMKTQEINQEIVELQGEISNLEERNVELTELLRYFDSESYAERKARMELGMKKPGESVVIVPDEALEVARADAERAEREDAPNVKKWWRYFFEKRDS